MSERKKTIELKEGRKEEKSMPAQTTSYEPISLCQHIIISQSGIIVFILIHLSSYHLEPERKRGITIQSNLVKASRLSHHPTSISITIHVRLRSVVSFVHLINVPSTAPLVHSPLLPLAGKRADTRGRGEKSKLTLDLQSSTSHRVLNPSTSMAPQSQFS
jgi:hypothetical protein